MKSGLKRVCLMLMTLFLLLLCGCESVVKVNESSLDNMNHQQAVQYDEKYYPVTVKSLNSKNEMQDFRYKKPPQRVVAVWQNSVETLLALGLGDRIIAGMGVPDAKYLLPQYREAYNKIPYTSLKNLDLETVMMMKPDFILAWNSTFSPKVLRSTEFWQKRDVNCYIAASSAGMERGGHTVEEECNYILDIGKIFDKNKEAEKIVNEMQDEIDYVIENTKNNPKRPRAIILEFLGKDISVYGEKTLAGNILQRLDGELLNKGEKRCSLEELVDLDPDAVFVVVTERDYENYNNYLNRLYKNKALESMHCLKNRRVYVLPLYAIYSAGIRTYDGIKIIARGLYPELYQGKKDPLLPDFSYKPE